MFGFTFSVFFFFLRFLLSFFLHSFEGPVVYGEIICCERECESRRVVMPLLSGVHINSLGACLEC